MEAVEEQTKRHTYYIRPSLHQELRFVALEKMMTVSDLVELALCRLLSNTEGDLKGEHCAGR